MPKISTDPNAVIARAHEIAQSMQDGVGQAIIEDYLLSGQHSDFAALNQATRDLTSSADPIDKALGREIWLAGTQFGHQDFDTLVRECQERKARESLGGPEDSRGMDQVDVGRPKADLDKGPLSFIG